MLISLAWLNSLLHPGDLSADEAERILTHVGFPIESREALPTGDTRLDVEITSNRGDCLCHLGLAREVAAATGRALRPRASAPLPGGGAPVGSVVALENTTPHACPRFTLRVVRGVKIGPSPAWLAGALEAAGQRSINNIVDCTNYVNFLLGNPCHAFDLARLEGARVVVRFAQAGEKLRTLDGKERTLNADELVVADARRAQSLAGVIGGADSEVHAGTSDVALEVATWDPGTVRRAARRLGIRTDASYRFERTVSAGTLDEASALLASLVVETAGGVPCDGLLAAGNPPPERATVHFRPERCRAVLGFELDTPTQLQLLGSHGIGVKPWVGGRGEEYIASIPHHRVDLTREVDLIEEVARTNGLDKVPTTQRLSIAVRPPQTAELARRELASTLTGLGFFEAVTFSFVSPSRAALFTAPGLENVSVDDARRAHEPTLRPSVLPGLLACRKVNQDGGVDQPGGVRLFEVASVFGQSPAGPGRPAQTVERKHLALVLDAPAGPASKFEDRQAALRLMRGAVEAVVRTLAGAGAALEFKTIAPPFAALDAGGFAGVLLSGKPAGYIGMVSGAVLKEFGLDTPAAAAELNLDALLPLFPPRARVAALPAFPATEKDLSVILDEGVSWARVSACVRDARPEFFEHLGFVTAYRGKQTGAGKKSVTLRLRFRAGDRTLRAEEADAQARRVAEHLTRELGGEFRTA